MSNTKQLIAIWATALAVGTASVMYINNALNERTSATPAQNAVSTTLPRQDKEPLHIADYQVTISTKKVQAAANPVQAANVYDVNDVPLGVGIYQGQ